MRRIMIFSSHAGTAAALAFVASWPALAASPPPIPPVLSVTAMGTVTQNPVIDGRDGTYSALIRGASYWAFNDTAMKQANASGKNFIDNTLSWATSLDATNGITLNRDLVDSTGVPTRFVPFTTAEAAFQYAHDPSHCTAPPASCGENLALWPGPIVFDPAGQQVIVPFGEIIRGGPISGFPSVGAGLAIGPVYPNGHFTLNRPIQNPGAKYPTLMWGQGEVAYTDQAFILGSTYYAYGGKGVFVTTEDQLARVPVAQILNKSAWTYYAGNGVWSTDPNAAVAVFDGGAAGSSVFYNAYLGEWMAIYSGNFTNDVYYRVAYHPEGPWSAQALLFTGQTGYQNNSDYAGRAHPEFSPDGGQTQYVTYVHDTGFLQQDLPLTRVVFGKPAS